MLRSLTQKDQKATLYLPNFRGRILIMRKLLILQSLSHAPGKEISYHKWFVREAEHQMLMLLRKIGGAR